MPNYGYHAARAHGAAARRAYSATLRAIPSRVRIERAFPYQVYSYSGEAALPEQVASIRSFLRHAGRPKKFTIVSDGTYSASSRELLRQLDESVSVSESAEWLPSDVPSVARTYLAEHPTGKQLALIMSLPVNEPALYFDSDVLFFAGARDTSAFDCAPEAPACYLADCRLSGDERLFRSADEQQAPVNTGVLLLRRKLDWSASMQRLLELEAGPTFFTNQTLTHLAMHANGARPFDPQRFVLELDDQFVYPDKYASPQLVLRHYVNPVRHKFWMSLWRSRAHG